ncbi:uncharacterized protein LOC143920201 isoform X4 [Arctopsyche grandis]|uniref:uncharacterized protein LOC143920201 isoform X4 n=1 Tax=Arctopsyche grandis TaxID=121162 RepID=UPI00406D9982
MVRSKMATPSANIVEDTVASSPTNSELGSICHVRRADLYPKRGLEADDPGLPLPFTPICGEAIQYLSRTQDGVLSLSNYRLFHRSIQGAATNIPLMLIESADVRDIFYLHIMCKDARSLRCIFTTGEQCMEWQRRISVALLPPADLEKFFAFSYRAWAVEPGGEEVLKRLAAPPIDPDLDFRKEASRLQFDLHGTWRVSKANYDFKLCPSYPPLLLVPSSVSDEALETVAKFRSSRRIPAVVWRHRGNGAVIARCSQPEVGWLGWRSNEDEQLLAAMTLACQDPNSTTSNTTRKLLIIDARSYASAVTNRARGGGCECPQYYPCAEIQFMCLPNIHSVRKSFQALRALAAEPPDHANWHSVLERSLWLQAIGGLLRTATIVARAVHIGGRPTLVHCSDGWDRTPQIVSTAQLMLDPYYRTCEGFRILVEREWLDFGHKFADRCGHVVGSEDFNERCPVFLQWLDCVHQILVQYPCSFEFSQAYLIKLAQHAYSCLFGTFLCNNRRERSQQNVSEKTFSVWSFLKGPAYQNHLYEPNREVLYPAHSARALVVWAAVYLGVAPDTPVPAQPPASPPPPAHSAPFHGHTTNGVLTKTRSYGDLTTLAEHGSTPHRRSSDPNIAIDSMQRSSLNLSGKSNSSISNNNNNNEQSISDNFSNEICNSESMLDQELKNFKSSKIDDSFSLLNNTANSLPVRLQNQTSDCLINTTVPKQIVNGYSKVNGNIVPTLNSDNKINSDEIQTVDSNSNRKSLDCEIEINMLSHKLESCNVNGNTQVINDISLIDSTYQNDIDHTDGYMDQVLDNSVHPDLDDMSKISSKDNMMSSKSEMIMGLTPTEEPSVFLDSVLSESGESSDCRIRHDSSTWRSISEFTDSSGGGDSNDAAQLEHLMKGSRMPRQRLDSVQNGGLNDTAADLLKSEIDKLIPDERAETQPDDCPTFVSLKLTSRPKSENVNAVSNLLFSEISDSTLCPNSPYKTIHRNHVLGAGVISKHSAQSVCTADNGIHTTDGRGEACCLSSLHHHECLGCTATHLHCLLHCLTHCTHGRQSSNSSITPNPGMTLDPVDGLICPQSPVQQRLHQIIQDHKMIEEALRKELLAARVELQQRACRTVRATPDHSEDNSPNYDSSACPQIDWNNLNINKKIDYFDEACFDDRMMSSQDLNLDCYPCSDSSSGTGDGSISGGSSGNDIGSISCASRSGSAQGKGSSGVLWVPDHAVSRCTRCDKNFWLGKRKHHCRNAISDHSLNLSSQVGVKARQATVLTSSHSSSSEVRHLSDYCKQVSGDQNINSSPVTAASN